MNRDEQTFFEEMYIAYQLMILMVLIMMSFPLFVDKPWLEMKLLTFSYGVYVVLRIALLSKAKLHLNNDMKFITGIVSLIFTLVFLMIQFNEGQNYLDFLYIFLLTQSFRLIDYRVYVYSFLIAIAHIVFVMNYSIIKLEGQIVISLCLYFILVFMTQFVMRHIHQLNSDKGYYMDALKDRNERLSELVNIDYLTDLFNHGAFQEYFQKVVRKAKLKNGNLCLALIDIDNFKRINDCYGHDSGDQVIRSVSNVIKENIRKTDYAARYGGEEFAIVLNDTSLQEAVFVLERLRKDIEAQTFETNYNHINVTVSIGVSQLPLDSLTHSKDAIFIVADQLLLSAKKSGKNQVRFQGL